MISTSRDGYTIWRCPANVVQESSIYNSQTHLSCDNFLGDKTEDYKNSSVLYYTPQLCNFVSTLIWTVPTNKLRWSFASELAVCFSALLFLILGQLHYGQSLCFIMRISSLHCCVFNCQYQCNWSPKKNRLWSVTWCVDYDVKHYLLTHRFTRKLITLTSLFKLLVLIDYKHLSTTIFKYH